jgi:hypothetical protein
MLPSACHDDAGTPDQLISRLNSPAHTYRCRRFAYALTGADARLAASVGRYACKVNQEHAVRVTYTSITDVVVSSYLRDHSGLFHIVVQL